MQRASEFVGKAVVSADRGERVGRAADLLVSAEGDRVLGIVVRDGVLSSERVLPYDEVQSVGPDAIVARSQEHVIDPAEWRRRDVQAHRSSALHDRRVVTRAGEDVGRIGDVCVDEETGRVEAYEVKDRLFGGLISRRHLLRRTGDVTIGPDVAVVSAAAARTLDPRERRERTRRPEPDRADDHPGE